MDRVSVFSYHLLPKESKNVWKELGLNLGRPALQATTLKIQFVKKEHYFCSSCSTAVERMPRHREVMGSIPAECWAFPYSSILIKVSLNRSLEEVQHYCFSFKK